MHACTHERTHACTHACKHARTQTHYVMLYINRSAASSKKGDIKYDMLMSQQQELRMVDIERENRVMLDKMSYVYRTPPSLDNLVSEYNAYLLSVVKRSVSVHSIHDGE